MNNRHVVILGNGITGITAARHLRKRGNDRITVVSGETRHHFSRTALMYIYMGDLTYNDTKPYEDRFWEENRIDLKYGWVRGIDTTAKTLTFEEGCALDYDELVVATGSKPNRFGWPGQDLRGVQGFYSFQDLETMEGLSSTTTHAVIAGGGLIGVEVAEMLVTRGIHVTFLVREKTFWGSVLPSDEGELVAREILRHGIDLRLGEEIGEILGDDAGRARAVRAKSGLEFPAQMVFLTAGVSPNIEVVRNSGIECDRGVLVDPKFRTSVPGVWSGGDCAQFRVAPEGRRSLEQVWYTGKMHGEHIAANLFGEEKSYDPGVWFNSAKFFDIEYQTYGTVTAKTPEGELDFGWQSPDGKMSFRVRFDSKDGAVKGMNVFGLRHRHLVWEAWIRNRTPVGEVLSDLPAANFDPEFYVHMEPAILAEFQKRFPDHPVKPRTRKGLFSSFFKSFRSKNPSIPSLS